MFTEEVACDATLPLPAVGKSPCAPGDHYPRRKRVAMHRLPSRSKLPTMPNPCHGVPHNPWCPGHGAGKRHSTRNTRQRRSRPPRRARGFTG